MTALNMRPKADCGGSTTGEKSTLEFSVSVCASRGAPSAPPLGAIASGATGAIISPFAGPDRPPSASGSATWNIESSTEQHGRSSVKSERLAASPPLAKSRGLGKACYRESEHE